MSSRQDYGILVGTLLLVSTFLTAGILVSPGFAPGSHAWEEAKGFLSALVLLPLIIFGVVVLALLNLDAGKSRIGKGELERLVELKRQGRLLPSASRRDKKINSSPVACSEGILAHLMATRRRGV